MPYTYRGKGVDIYEAPNAAKRKTHTRAEKQLRQRLSVKAFGRAQTRIAQAHRDEYLNIFQLIDSKFTRTYEDTRKMATWVLAQRYADEYDTIRRGILSKLLAEHKLKPIARTGRTIEEERFLTQLI